MPSRPASWEEDKKRTPVGKKGIGKVPGKRESLAGPGTWTESSAMDKQWGQENGSSLSPQGPGATGSLVFILLAMKSFEGFQTGEWTPSDLHFRMSYLIAVCRTDQRDGDTGGEKHLTFIKGMPIPHI